MKLDSILASKVDSDDSYENFQFFTHQNLNCSINLTSGIPEWAMEDIAKCEPRDCNVTDAIRNSSEVEIRQYRYDGTWHLESIDFQKTLLSTIQSLPFDTQLSFTCPNSSNSRISATCGAERSVYYVKWDAEVSCASESKAEGIMHEFFELFSNY